jgi:NADPH2:quinone reductase
MVILIHAAAGGVGSLMVRLAKHYKAMVIATVGSEEKAEFVRKLGADHVINYEKSDFKRRVSLATNGFGVNVVYDSIGKMSFEKSIECLMDFGLMVSFGESSGRVPDFDLEKLSKKSLFISRPNLQCYKQDRVEFTLSVMQVFGLIESGVFPKETSNKYEFSDIPKIHDMLKNRKTIGPLIVKLEN